MIYDELEQFLNWYMTSRAQCPPSGEIINDDGRVSEVILFRQGQFQVQLCVVQPNTEGPDHIHPGVDSFEVYMGGDIIFRKDREQFMPQRPGKDTLRIYPNTSHGGTFGNRGGMFLSVQRWLNGVEPTFISRDWEFTDPDEKDRNKCI